MRPRINVCGPSQLSGARLSTSPVALPKSLRCPLYLPWSSDTCDEGVKEAMRKDAQYDNWSNAQTHIVSIVQSKANAQTPCTRARTHASIHTHTYGHIRMRTNSYVHALAYIHTYIHSHTHTCIHLRTYRACLHWHAHTPSYLFVECRWVDATRKQNERHSTRWQG